MATVPEMQAAIDNYTTKLSPILLNIEASGNRIKGTKDYVAAIKDAYVNGSLQSSLLVVQTSLIDNDTDLATAKNISDHTPILDLRNFDIWKWRDVDTGWEIIGKLQSVPEFPRGRYHFSVFNSKTYYITLNGTLYSL